ncbi:MULTISPECIES: hypothetical protein [unclassified Bacillus (in: firmicutes)]|uniref:hypothetical protein n=1 Tax=unclassified Bacillus (in: firmicutes) TaxID=185979 RepID=UPI000BF0B3E3|nr:MULTISPECIES: hypothetical protein [unclassified Bacillus (in: firmicutes)]PEJ52109.1 hypothetical protein CN692_22240 [Bacillus sp. AFS002410]PEL11206.1 hypothetical protein CN601_10635 [Bacillus sp. AFS017336]
MSIRDFILLFYCFIIFLSVPIGYRYVSKKTKETGQFLPFLVVSLAIVLADGILSILIWSMFTSQMDTFMYIGGLLTGMIFTSICGLLLFFVLLLRRKYFINTFSDLNPALIETNLPPEENHNDDLNNSKK